MPAPFSLLVLTDAYPFGHSENFFETELETLRQRCEVVIVPSQRCNRSVAPLAAPEHVQAFLDSPKGRGELASQLVRSVSTLPVMARWLLSELRQRHDVWLEPRGLYLLAWFVWHAVRTYEDADRALQRFGLEPAHTIAYAYWSWPSALSALLLQAKYPALATVARCHGGDVYEERHRPAYLPFRPLFAKKLDRIAFISEHGRNYFTRRWAPPVQHLVTARLGVAPAPRRAVASFGADPSKPLEVVSCAYAVPVKRLPLMHDAVLAVARAQAPRLVRWSHLGDGPQLASLRSRIAEQPLPNLEVRLLGHVDPAEVIEHYQQHPVDVFLNTSENEGVPVSIMEAFSCGIPVVAPRVGGVPEIVDSTCGVLVPVDASAQTFADGVLSTLAEHDHHRALREGAFARWASDYRADHNFERFFEDLVTLRQERSRS